MGETEQGVRGGQNSVGESRTPPPMLHRPQMSPYPEETLQLRPLQDIVVAFLVLLHWWQEKWIALASKASLYIPARS